VTSRLRVALLHYTAPPIPGGVEAILGEHARLLRDAGHNVRVVSGRGDGDLVPEVDSRHPAVQALYEALGRGEVDAGAYDELTGRLMDKLGALLGDRDVIVAHNVMTMPFNLPLASALVNLRKPLVAWTHDVAWVNPRYAEYQREGWPYELMRRPQPGTHYVAISDVRRQQLTSLFGLSAKSISLVPNGLDADAFLGVSPQTRELLDRAGLSAANPFLLVPLRITPRKRLELAVEAAALVRSRHPDVRICISGPLGPHSAANRDYWAALAAQRAASGLDGVVVFLHEFAGEDGAHPVTASMIAELYRLADAVVMPSESEGFGLPVIEAALARTPVVCADIRVLREAGGGSLHTFPAGGGAPEIADAIEAALDEPHVRDRRRVLAMNSWAALLGKIEATLVPPVG
jgi:glycosyltransferase involved in cell wall biosynthesis